MKPLDPAVCTEYIASSRWRVVQQPDGCVLWAGGAGSSGYVRVRLPGMDKYPAHRVALVARLGRDILAGMQVGHLCHDHAVLAGTCHGGPTCPHRRCVNPEHLVEQTPSQNVRAGNTLIAQAVAKETCLRGHPLSGDNLRRGIPARGCRTCETERLRQWYLQKKGRI